MRYVIALALMLVHGSAMAHELTPTYPEMRNSFIEGISVTNLQLFNRREDVSHFVIDVYTEEWEPVQFATSNQVIQVNYLQKANFEVYIRDADLERATYICTTSKLLTNNVESTGISSRICSRIN